MKEEFSKLSPNSRIWIYQSAQKIDPAAQTEILKATQQFLKEWAAHGSQLLASATIEHDHFLIIAVDENFNMASGCSIDSQFRFVQDIEKQFDLDLFDRTQLAFYRDDKVDIQPMKNMTELIAQGYFEGDVYFFDNNIKTKSELAERWRILPEESWLKRYFKKANSVL